MSLSLCHTCFQNHDQETKGRIKPSRRRVFVGKEKPPSFLVKAGALQTGLVSVRSFLCCASWVQPQWAEQVFQRGHPVTMVWTSTTPGDEKPKVTASTVAWLGQICLGITTPSPRTAQTPKETGKGGSKGGKRVPHRKLCGHYRTAQPSVFPWVQGSQEGLRMHTLQNESLVLQSPILFSVPS